MKQIFKLYKKDLKTVVTNYAALIVVVALAILPSLYAWFNIKASWDPYGSEVTKNIKVGVVNEDEDVTLNGSTINLGERMVEELKENTQLGWQFVTSKEAKDALDREEYYAYITIPSDFSKRLTSIISHDIEKGELIYTVNEKMNAIAPKLTDKGVTSLQSTVSKTVVETVSNIIFEIANEIGVSLENEIPNISAVYDKLLGIQEKFDAINSTVTDVNNGVKKTNDLLKDIKNELPNVEALLTNSKDLGTQIKEFLTLSKELEEKLAPSVQNQLVLAGDIADSVLEYLNNVKVSIDNSIESAPELLEQGIGRLTIVKNMADNIAGILTKINSISPDETLTGKIDVIKSLSDKANSLQNALTVLQQKAENGEINTEELTKVINTAESIKDEFAEFYTEFATTIKPLLSSIFDKAQTVTDSAVTELEKAAKALPEVSDILDIALDATKKGEKGIAIVEEVLPKAEEKITDFITVLNDVLTDGSLNKLVDLLKADVEARSDFLANPLTITEEKIYPMGNYGTSMTPFYTVLCLWVGIPLLVSILSVDEGEEYRPYQIYFGKLLLFMTITILQALIVSLGDLYLLKIYCKSPAGLIASSLLTSICFTVIVYSLVSVFHNVGKVIGIILLVLQVAGSGGTFPIQLTPKFFQMLYPFLPFTYCISLQREAIGGKVDAIVTKDIAVIGIFIAAFLVLALALKRPINKLLHGFSTKFEESGLGS